MQLLLLILSAVLVIAGPVSYATSIIRGKSKPHRMTRFILFFVLALNFFSILAAHSNTGVVVFAGITFAQATVIFALSIWHGMGGSSVLDWTCLVIAGVGILGWKLTGNPLMGVWFAIFADFAAYIPAYVKTWKHPHTESPWYYSLSIAAAFISLIAYNIELASLFQIYIIVGSAIMLICIYRKELLPQKAKR